jgi:hypothetical protein
MNDIIAVAQFLQDCVAVRAQGGDVTEYRLGFAEHCRRQQRPDHAARCADLSPAVPCGQHRMRPETFDIGHSSVCDAGCVESRGQFIGGHRCGRSLDRFLEQVAIGYAVGVRRKARIGHQSGQAKYLPTQPLPFPLILNSQ